MSSRPLALLFALVAACGGSDDGGLPGGGSGMTTTSGSGNGNGVTSTADAKQAYMGLDASIDKAITLGFDGFNAATSANIPPQTAKGDKAGTMTVAGQVDQGASNNKSMHLTVALAGYSDDGQITYATSASALPTLGFELKKIPNGTFSGALDGAFGMTGALTGSVTLALTFTGVLEPDPADPAKVRRKPGTTHIVGTATSAPGTYTVDVTR
jgi:hypothetical protein